MGAGALGAGLAFGPIVRSRVAREADRRHLQIDVGAVRPGWFAVRLEDVRVRSRDDQRISATVDEVRVELGVSLTVEHVRLRGGRVAIDGSPAEVRDSIERWGAAARDGAGSGDTGKSIRIDGEALAATWNLAGALELGGDARLEAAGIGFAREAGTTRVAVESATIRTANIAVAAGGASFEVDSSHAFKVVHLATAAVELIPAAASPPSKDLASAVPSASASSATIIPLTKNASVPNGDQARAKKGTAPLPIAPMDPLVPLPQVTSVRAKLSALASTIASRLPDGCEISIDALSVKRRGDLPLSFGPGPLNVAHHGARVDIRFASLASPGTTPLALQASLPSTEAEATITLEGGPVSLALLGVHERAFGLTDVEQATVAGKGRVVVAADSLTFDGDVRVRGAALVQPRLAAETLRGLDVGVTARGVLAAHGELRVDDFTISLGSLHATASGTVQQNDGLVVAKLRFEIPSASCQAILDSVPTALVPTVKGAKYAGTFGARGVFELDSRALDDLLLTYDVQDRCEAVEVPPAMARSRFKQAFTHRIYLPDGSTSEETTGPGTPKWVPFGGISPYMTVAVLTTEDGGFYRHHGFSHGAIKASLIANLKARRFVRGASTISMQLAKNLFLAREKTLSRKLEEMILTDYLEQVFSKDELMELYLNIIEFGPNVYGIGPASWHYFGRGPSELNLAECLFLSSMLPAPLRHHYLRDQGQLSEGWTRTLQHLMTIAKKTGLISEEELEEGKNEAVVFHKTGPRPPARRHSHLDAPAGEDDTPSQESN